MTPDKDIQELFDSVNIPFSDNDAFLNSLNQRLEKVEFIKKTQDAQINRYKVSVIYSLIAGLVVGAGSMTLVQTLPEVALEKFSYILDRLSILGNNDQIATFSSCIALFIGVASFMITRNLMEIRGTINSNSTTTTT